MIGPIDSYCEACNASAYAMAPLKPANHMTNYVFGLSFDFSVLVRFTKKLTIQTLRNRAIFKLRIVEIKKPQLIESKGWLNAKTPIPRNKNTIVSAEYAITSYIIFMTFFAAGDIFGDA